MNKRNPVLCFEVKSEKDELVVKELIVLDKITHVETRYVEGSATLGYEIRIYVIGREWPIILNYDNDKKDEFETTFDMIRLAIDHNQSYNDDKMEVPEFVTEEIKKYFFNQNG